MSTTHIAPDYLAEYRDVYTDQVLNTLEALSHLNAEQKTLMSGRNARRKKRIENGTLIQFLDKKSLIGNTGLSVADARAGRFNGSEIPHDLQRQWIQGTGPAAKPNATLESSIRNVAYALLSGADGWMFDGEDALGQIKSMSLDNQRNLKLAIHKDPIFLKSAEQVATEMNRWSKDFLKKKIVDNVHKQLEHTTIIFRARGLHLDDRHITMESGDSFSASITDLILYVVNNYEELQRQGRSIVVYLPKIQTANEAAFWNHIITELESHLGLKIGTIKTYVLVEQLEATFQLMEIRAALSPHFVGFNTGRWDYINSVADAMAGISNFINPNIEAISMTYSYMAAYEDRVRKAVNTPDQNGNYALWQGGMEPNIPVGSEKGIEVGMEKALAGAKREQGAGASGKWVAHWKMVHLIRPVWEKAGEDNQLGRPFETLTYTDEDQKKLIQLADAPRTIRGARNLLSVALQYGNAFLQGFQAAALKPADFFKDDDILYLMEDMATGEIRVSVLWEWLHKKAKLTESDQSLGLAAGDSFTKKILNQLLEEEYEKLLHANSKDVHEESKTTTLPISKLIVERFVTDPVKAPWFIDLLNLNLNNEDLSVAHERVDAYYNEFKVSGQRITANQDTLVTI
ncbi:malate synthase [Ekhidna sp.]|uniref:malate synthase n=1 Tax=Ekhidna sp. TaxID=2608089 RepID=UPI003C7CB544